MTSKYDFAYSVARVRTLETLLLNENEVERMMLAKDANEAFRILNEFDYADNKAAVDDVADFQKVIDEGLMDIKEILTKITPDKRILNIIWHPYDFHNIKTLIKAKLSNRSFEDVKNIMNPMGAIEIEALKKFIMDEENIALGLNEKTEQYLKKRIKKVQLLFEKNKNPLMIDLYLDQKLMKIIYNIAKDSKNTFLIEYLRHLIDLNNVKLFFRMKAQGKELDLFEMAFLWHGSLTLNRFKEAYNHSLNEFPELFAGTKYSKIINTGYKHYEEEKTFIFLEKEIENHLTEFIKQAKLIAFGPEALIAYFLAKKNNALIIRMILVNKLNHIEPEEIRGRLRNLYR